MSTRESFSALGLTEKTITALEAKGFEEPTEIQKACIPLLLDGECDVVGQAQTGTGKTAAFGLPILERIDESDRNTQALIMAPTRELAMQVADEIASLAGDRHITIGAIYGGTGYEQQFKQLKRGLQIVVGTPGRIQDHLERGTLDISHIHFAVLDEADEMLDMGFIDDIRNILSLSPEDKRMLLFSATMPAPILHLAESFMHDYQIVRIKKKESEEVLTDQYYYILRESDKMEALCRIIDISEDFYAVVFCRTKLQAEEIGRKLSDRGYDAEALHGDLSQKQREIILSKMKDHRISILVATDVAARGIDIQELTHVINYTIPQDPEAYIHRVGRTGRAGRKGTAITFVTKAELRKLAFIKKVSKFEINEGSLPSPDEIISARRGRIIASLEEALQNNNIPEIYTSVVEELGADNAALAALLLSRLYKGDLDITRYTHIRSMEKKEPKKSEKRSEERSEKHEKSERKEKGDKEERSDRGERRDRRYEDEGPAFTRLFVAYGRKDGFTKRKLANLLIEECRLRDEDIRDMEVMEEFSFINIPSRYAESVLRSFSTSGEGGRPLVVRAKPEKGTRKAPVKTRAPKTSFRTRRKWEDEAQPYGRDSRDEDDWTLPRKSKKAHGKYNTRSRRR